MFEARRHNNAVEGAFALVELIYHSTVREVRRGHRSALGGLLLNILQTVIFVGTFYLMMNFFGMRRGFGSQIRGDFLLYLMSGVFIFLIHIKAMGAVVKADGPTSPMMQHAPLTTAITITSSALASLYLQLLSMFVVLFFYHVLLTPIEIDKPAGAMAMVMLAWGSGVAVGLLILAIKPWMPDFGGILATIWGRANMVASGKMFAANSLPGSMLIFFVWNPLFHIIDQCRGFIFINYAPHVTSIAYPVKVTAVLIMLGLLGEFFTRGRASVSWKAGR